MDKLFEQKWRECEKSVFLVALGYLHDTEAAADCVQEAALSAFRGFDSLKNTEYFKTWLTRIVINKSKNYLKRRKYTECLTDSVGAFCSMPEEEMAVLDCVMRLKPVSARYITLRFYNDMTYETVASVLGQPVSTVKYKTKKALKELKMLLEGEC